MDTREYLAALFEKGNGFIGISTLVPGKKNAPKTEIFNVSDLDRAADYVDNVKHKRHVYVGCGMFDTNPTKRGTESEVSAVTFFHADIDIFNPAAHAQQHLPPDVDAALGLMGGLPEPTFILQTGNGLLPIWVLETPLRDVVLAKSILKGIQQTIIEAAKEHGWKLDNTADLARLTRVLGTLNHKTNPAKRVEIISETGTKYAAGNFEAYKAPIIERKPRNVETTITIEQAQELLSFIPKQQEYDQWLRVLMALHASFDWDTALDLAEQWSPGFPGEIEYKFHSFEDNEPLVTAGTLFHLARQHGYAPPFKWTDIGNGERMAWFNGDRIRYLYSEKRWLVWDGARWAGDHTGMIEAVAKQTALDMYGDLARISDDQLRDEYAKHIKYSASGRGRTEMIRSAQSEPGIPIRPEQLDENPWLFNVANGTVDLRTGELLPHDPANLMTKLAPVGYDAAATCPTWERFVDRVTDGDKELAAYVQQAVGYALTGDTSEQCLFFMYGTGKNGKSTFVETLMALFGDYQLKAPTSMLMAKKGDSIPNDVAALSRGARFVVAAELSEGGRMDESLVKDLTGNDTLTARYLHNEFFQFRPTHKLFMYGNHKPIIRGGDAGIWRRVRLVPFTVEIPEHERDPRLMDKLRAELPGILAWAVRGCMAWQQEQDGLHTPAKVMDATNDYRADMDVLGEFLAECCEVGETRVATKAELYGAYAAWCKRYGETALSHKAFAQRMIDRGFTDRRGTGGLRLWVGLSVNELFIPGYSVVDGPKAGGTLATMAA